MLVKIGIALLVIGSLLSGVLYDYPAVAENTAFFAFAGLIMLVVAFYKKLLSSESSSGHSASPQRQLRYSPEEKESSLARHRAYVSRLTAEHLNASGDRDQIGSLQDDFIDAYFSSLFVHEDSAASDDIMKTASYNDGSYLGTKYSGCGSSVWAVMVSEQAQNSYRADNSSILRLYRQYKD